MKITIFTNKDLSSVFALNQLIPRLQHHELQVYFSSQVGPADKLADEREGLMQLQTFEQKLLVNLPMVTSRTNNNTTLTQLLSFASLQQKYHIPFKNFTMVNTTQGLSFLKQQAADLWLSIRYGKIFKKPAIALPRKGIINLHSGILPDYRGVMATFRAMLNGDSHIGCSLHFIDDDNIDQGRIISRTKILLQKNHSYLWNLINLYTEGCQLLIDAVETLANNNEIFFIKNRDGNKLQGRYFSFPTPQDLCQFAELSYQLFDELEITKLCHSFKAVENP